MLFPERFDLRLMTGPRSKQFSSGEDAFQQLVGDGLRAMTGHLASIVPTSGQDGSIDGFLEIGALLTGPFKDVQLPAIIECKSHDDRLGRVLENVFQGWRQIEGKLRIQAQNGWPNHYSPWRRAEAYVYCVSILLPSQHTRDDLKTKIEAFFRNLSVDQRPPIKSIRVLDWGDVRPWLNQIPIVADGWLGISLPAILDHGAYATMLTGFRKYLLNSQLPFVAPEQSASWHPSQLLKRLGNDSGKAGLLLIGAGGVGKTRLSFEVASQASVQGWRVLHVEPILSEVTVESLAQIILPEPCQTLLVFDYLEQMQSLNLDVLRRTLLPAAASRGIRLALLANCRPGWTRIRKPERDELFWEVRIPTTARHNLTVTESIADGVARNACRLIGRDEVIRLCGTRPSIALLIARELESRAMDGDLQRSDLGNLRSGDLVHWLRRRLKQDSLHVEGGALLVNRPSVPMVAAAAALAYAPAPRGSLHLASRSTLNSLGWDRPDEAFRLVSLLEELGWLEQRGQWLATAHDVVADEVMDQVIRDATNIRAVELEAILAGGLNAPEIFGALAIAIRRVLGSLESDLAIEQLHHLAVAWLRKHGASFGAAFAASEADSTAFALAAVVGGPPWADAAYEMWNVLVEPWWNKHGRKEEARHLLYSVLKGREQLPAMFLDAALEWLRDNGRRPSASFVIGELLGKKALSSHACDLVVRGSLEWLNENWSTFDAGFVIPPLLARHDLPKEHARSAIWFAMQWLPKYCTELDAQFVFHSLLRRRDLSRRDEGLAVDYSVRWLHRYRLRLEAGFVLPPLLRQPDLARHADIIIRLSLEWLDIHIQTVDAEFVLKYLLKRADVQVDDRMKLIEAAIKRIKTKVKDQEASYLLRWCLQSRINNESFDTELISCALNWLERNAEAPDADFVFNRLLRRPHLTEADWRSTAKVAIQFLKTFGLTRPDRDRTINSLLTNPHWLPEEELNFVIELALNWIETQNRIEEGTSRMIASLNKVVRHFPDEHPLAVAINKLTATHPAGEFDRTVLRLKFFARNPQEEVGVGLIEESCRMTQLQARRSPVSAAFAIPALLVLASRIGGETLKKVIDLTAALVDDFRFHGGKRSNLASKCRELLDAGAFPNRDEAERMLGRLGL